MLCYVAMKTMYSSISDTLLRIGQSYNDYISFLQSIPPLHSIAIINRLLLNLGQTLAC